MPLKKRQSKLWVPTQIYCGSNARVFVHPHQLKRFRKGAERFELEMHDKTYSNLVKRTPFIFKNIEPEQFKVMQLIRKAGLPTEEVVYYIPKTGDLLVRNKGAALQFILQRKKPLTPKVRRIIMNGIAGYFGKMHSLNIEHHHPGTNNIVFYNGKISVIDFKYAEFNPKLDWRNPEAVYDFFKEDYRCLIMMRKEIEIDAGKLIHNLISKYNKMSEENKAQLERIIKEKLNHWFFN